MASFVKFVGALDSNVIYVNPDAVVAVMPSGETWSELRPLSNVRVVVEGTQELVVASLRVGS
jgi:hypothetical protein